MVNSTDSIFQSHGFDDHSNHLRHEASSGDRRLDRLNRRADDGDPLLVNTMLDSGASDHFVEKGSDRFPECTNKNWQVAFAKTISESPCQVPRAGTNH